MNSLYNTIDLIRNQKPLIHHITNLVTINDCANITLAIGALPIMAMDPSEVGEVTPNAKALVINMGTLSQLGLDAMLISGKIANELSIPVVLDPTGIGISSFRKSGVNRILENIKVDIVKGNVSEIKTLLGVATTFKGVDSLDIDEAQTLVKIAQEVSSKLNTVVVCTGEIDIITSNKDTICVKGGTPMLKNITGTGCMLGSLIGSYVAVSDDKVEAVEMAVMSMNIAGERAYSRMIKENRGSGSYKVFLLDEIYNLTSIGE